MGEGAVLQFPYYRDPGLTRADQLSDADTAAMIRQVADAAGPDTTPAGILASMDSSTKWLVGAGLGLVAWAVFIRR
jgi:hypothetical protein